MELNYRIKSINEVSFNQNYDFPYDNMDKDKINYQFSHEIKLEPKSNEIIINLSVFLNYGENEEKLYSETVRTSFEVKPFENLIKNNTEGAFEVAEPQIIDTFINVTIGAARGMIAKNLKGTLLSDCVLPLVPMSIIREASLKK